MQPAVSQDNHNDSRSYAAGCVLFRLSMGAPGIPGSGLICLSILLTQIGVPMEALALMIGIDSLMGMFRTTTNVTGDVATTLIVAKTENMLDMDKYKS